jgi:hypothetical protein
VPSLRRVTCARLFAITLFAVASASCSKDDVTPPPPTPVVTTISVTVPTTSIVMGATTTVTAAAVDQNGAPIALTTTAWTTSSAAIATVNATGVVTGVSVGTTQVIASGDGKTGQQTITVTAPPAIRINEVESNGGTPGDWVELYNPTTASVDVSGWGFRDNDTTHAIYRLPAGTSIAAGGYLVVEEAAVGFGLGAADDARLYSQYNVVVDSYSWTTHAAITYGRCPNGTGDFGSTTVSTKGAANTCTPPVGPVVSPWPGSDDAQTVDGVAVFGGNLSGLTYEGASGGTPPTLWAVRNGPGTLYRLVFLNGIWTPDPLNGWAAGRLLHYTDDLGDADAEGVTFATGGSAGGIYVATERNNSANAASRNSVLRFEPAQAGTTLRATNDWNLTSDLPAVGANLGIEAITWIPDSVLVAKKFFDETAGHAYVPAEYANHGTGLFFVGVEANGKIYAYALDHVTNGYKRIASFSSGNTGVMGLEYDRDTGHLWATCDDGCGNIAGILDIDTRAGSATLGRFLPPTQFARPSTLPNVNNEGFAIAPQSECVNGLKSVFWADDSETGGHSIRRASLSCASIPPAAAKVP